MDKSNQSEKASGKDEMNVEKRILIVDDEETLTFSLYQAFIKSPANIEVITAASGEEAARNLAAAKFDLVLTDIRMPGMDGLELLTQIKKKYPGTRVIVMTAYGSLEKKEESIQKGADYYLEKGTDLSDIRKAVMEFLQ
jgi:DNA-binding NtrC family response regulator